MGIVGVMAGLPKNIWMRIVFISLLCGFALIEMRASDKDRARYEQQWEQARQQEHSDFQSMVRGLEDSNATNQQKFNATMQQMNSVLESTQVLTGLSKENLADITGGDDYCYVDAATGLHGDIFVAFLVGNHPIYDLAVQVRVMEPPYNQPVPFFLGNMIHGMGTDINFSSDLEGKEKRVFYFNFSARNGYWTEEEILTKGARAARVFNFDQTGKITKILRQWESGPFPKDKNGKIDWDSHP